nr:lipopolysaccharide biosynthesis protein [uncultured Prevotella sp.]
MTDSNIKNKTVTGFFWQLSQKVLCQVVSFGISVVLARLLLPSDYGVIAICSMFLVLTGIFIGGGLGTALVQKKNADDIDFCTVFYSGLVLSIVVYLAVFFAAPYIAIFFKNEQITAVIRVLALSMPIGTLSGVQNAFVSKQMIFKKFFYSSLIGTIASGAVGLGMALTGFGVWALVGQNLVSTITNTLVLFCIIDWHPKLIFSYERFKQLFSFGWKMAVVNILTTFFYQLKGYVIGYKYSAAQLAYYNRGEGLPGILYNNINGTISDVLFPALSQLQDDKEALKRALSRAMRISSFFLIPALFGLAAISDKLVIIIFSEKWAPSIPFMQVICMISCSDILGMANYQAIKAVGRADTLLKMEFLKRPAMFAVLIVTMFISPLAIAVGQLVYSILAFVVNAYPNRKYIGYPIWQQMKDVGKNFLISLVMAIVVYLLGTLGLNMYVSVVLQVVTGALLYYVMSRTLNKEDYGYVMNFVKEKFRH